MSRIALLGGAYSSRSLIASAQRCINLFPEATPEAASPPTPVAHLLTPGLTLFKTPGAVAMVRALYRCTNGVRIAVIGTAVYAINVFNGAVQTLSAAISAGATRVDIVDNGIVAVITTGVAGEGWWFSVATGLGGLADTTLHTIVDAAFFGGHVAFLDGWFAFNRPGTSQFYLSPPFWDGVTAFDGTQIASKTGGPDPIGNITTVNGNLWLVGVETTEVWFNAGAQDFPFERQPGVLIQYGINVTTSLVATDVEVMFLGRSRAGGFIVLKSEGYALRRISTYALESHLTGQFISDAIGLVYEQGGHTFYVLTFPTLNETWVYDLATGEWHQRTSIDPGTGIEGRHRASAVVYWDDAVYVGDYANGKIYTFDQTNGTDAGTAINRVRAFPHVVKDGKRISYDSFIADMDVSQAAGGSVSLRWSDDRGATYGTPIALPIVTTYTSLILRRLGMARDRVFELSWNFPYQTSLQGAWIEVEKAET